MRIALAKESEPGEARVAMVPELVGGLITAGYEFAVQPGAGQGAMITDEAYAAAGATITEDALQGAELIISVQPLPPELVADLPPGTATLSFLPYSHDLEVVRIRRDARVTSFAMDLVPRISRAQSMDALTSQAMVAGYRGAIVAAGMLRQFFPMSMTAAGTIPPAQVVVLGAGVAGLQAIATARRLGAVVKGYDVRPAASEEIASMGAIAIELDLPPLDGAGGYAREMSPERALLQQQRLTPYLAAADAVITTASVPNRRPPILITRTMTERMKPDSVIVDLAADTGGNVEDVRPGTVTRVGQARVWGGANVPSQLPGPASRLYAQNVANVIMLMTADGRFAPDYGDEVVAGMCLTRDGMITHGPAASLIDTELINDGVVIADE
ncbi:NAD(P) transhydrogenase subunit alpha [Microlunatus parietis]|uniref:proton-translocating NAD(P)(+) transhydrogenase n=1 Tax=Microlunatus parietis TaxID=682979 RepID=A0A7Y9LAL2_9ACTN|nr:NAD(P) transhydrogenase subunit alpha [Microlunatus parietis]NYE72959.1 NAD(P) transhydrogenase subunit alpha [Microlunatus parietis]